MITKAKILQLPKGAYTNEQGDLVIDNKFKIYVPIFCRAGETKDNSLGLSTMYATLCYNPGAENGYRVDDIVYISFENNQVGEPVIIGKLFLNNTQESNNSTYLIGDELNISNNAKLPMNTTIGDIKGEDINRLFRQVANNENRIDNLSNSKQDKLTWHLYSFFNNKQWGESGDIFEFSINILSTYETVEELYSNFDTLWIWDEDEEDCWLDNTKIKLQSYRYFQTYNDNLDYEKSISMEWLEKTAIENTFKISLMVYDSATQSTKSINYTFNLTQIF